MNTRGHFRLVMAERRSVRKDSAEYEYLTKAARKLVWIMDGVPACYWPE